ncbi:protein kinase [Methanococcoides methylutens]|uniref:Protein kinase n=1 Tax=Methanococcoides methylutens TaxID=2226 RepID=A0A099T386_METMT|nr:lipopolysaccharide core heptose(II) kinase RfaY [Methanococcoides methylutens]KGK98666.1 protein kinase [Methanococcoides methylutens]
MFKKTRRYISITKVFFKYNLFSLLYKDIQQNYVSNKKGTCYIDVEMQKNARKLRLAFEDLGVTFIKLGQIMSKRPDLLPLDYTRELSQLQNKVRPLELEEMAESLEGFRASCSIAEADASTVVSEFLSNFDDFKRKPIASASIAQVYEARIGGKRVAVKIAKPGLIDQINVDLAIINDLKPLMKKMGGFGNNIDIDDFLDEFQDMLNKEVDLLNEARNIKRFEELFAESHDVHIPAVHDEYCTESILVMDYMEGILVKDLETTDQKTRSKYAHIISSSYLNQVYLHGFYHADPHSGNILLRDDGIAFIDFGAVGLIDSELRRNMLNLFYGIYKKNVDIAFDAFLKIADINKEEINVHKFKVDLDTLISIQNFALGERQNDSYANLALKYNLSLPSDFSTLERSLVIVEGVCLELDPRFNIIEDAKRLIFIVMTKRYSPFKAGEYFLLEGDRYLEIFKNLPQGVNDVIETIRGYRIEKLEEKTREIKHDRMVENLAKYVFLSIILVASAYLASQSEGSLATLGIAGFVVAIFMFGVLFLRSQ